MDSCSTFYLQCFEEHWTKAKETGEGEGNVFHFMF